MPIKRVLSLFILSFSLYSTVIGQVPDFQYSFDDCSYAETNGLLPDAQTLGSPACECGLNGNSIELDGNDAILLPDTLISFLDDNFSIEFYFFNYGSVEVTDIFSIKNRCTLDSLLAVKYYPASNEIYFEGAENALRYKSIRTPLKSTQCWHQVVITKQALEYSLYLDGEYINTFIAELNIPFGKTAVPAFSNSPCVAVNEDRMIGRIDEFNFYKRALSLQEIRNIYLYPDNITSRDTTIFSGDAVQINVGASCFDDFNWTPSISLDDPNELEPFAEPALTTTYTLTTETNNCISTDTVRINVLDKDALDCSQLSLPKAFTPNNDGLNDYFGISNSFIVESIDYFEIYDRWGAKVFIGNESNALWDGSINGKPVNPGMFLYKIKYRCQGEEFVAIDNFTVLR
jgi:gliding motility-associated-like protein